jgi:hypothetical protein
MGTNPLPPQAVNSFRSGLRVAFDERMNPESRDWFAEPIEKYMICLGFAARQRQKL